MLFGAGGWALAGLGIVGMFPRQIDASPWIFPAILIAFAAPLLLVATWVSPGRRMAELGLTLMISAGVAVMVGVTMAAIAMDPAMQRYMQRPMPKFDFTSSAMIVSLLAIAALGYGLRRWGMRGPEQ